MKNYDFLCLNFWTSLNYGAVLTAYATQNILTDFGYSCAHIDYKYKHIRDKYEGSFTDKFAKTYLHKTNECKSYNDFIKLNNIAKKGFIVGSDQVFRDDYIKKTADFYLLNFAKPNKQRIAISASFGKDSFNLKNKEYSFKAFDAISVREDNAVGICQKLGVNATHILDPVFLAKKEIFEDLAKSINFREEYKNKIIGYILDDSQEIIEFTKKFGGGYINIAKMNISVEEFLAYLYYSKQIITDSFHGTCFTIIFNKNFKTFDNCKRGSVRFTSLFKTFNLEYDNLISGINWNDINRIIKLEQERGLIYLKKIFENDNKINSTYKQKTFINAFIKNKLKSILKKEI